MRLSPLLALTLWVVVAGGEEPETTTDYMEEYHLQNSQGAYRYGYKTNDQMAQAEGDTNSEVKGKYAYVDKNGDMQGVEYTAGVNGYVPRILNKEEAEASILEPTIKQTSTEDAIPKNIRYQNRPESLHHSKRGREIEQTDETKEETGISATEKNAEKTNLENGFDQSEAMNPTGYDEEKMSSIEETVQGKYTYIEEDGLPATIEYEAGPGIGFVVKSFTKESLQSRLVEKGSDAVYDKDGLTVRKENSPEKSIYNEEGTEETYPEGFVRGLYTFTDEDGIPATVEYEAGPKIGFVVKKFSKGDVQLDQLGQGTGTSLSNSTVIVPSSIQSVSSEGEPVKFSVNEKPLESLTKEYASSKPRHQVPMNQEYYQDDDSAQIPSFTKDQSSNNDTRIHSSEQEDLVEQPDEEEDKEIPMNAAYRFGFSVKDQTRHEEADALGNVHGNYSYVDGAGLLTKVEYEAGAKKGFVIKRMTHEHTKTRKAPLQNEIHQTQNFSVPAIEDKIQKTHTDQNVFSNQQNQLSDQRQNLHETMIDGYEVSPYALREYVDERNLPVRSELNTELGSLDKDSSLASGSTNHFSFAHPEAINFKSDDSHVYKPPHKNEAGQNHYFSHEPNIEMTSSPYSIFYRDPNYSSILEEHDGPTIKSYKYFSYFPNTEPRHENRQLYQNTLSKGEETYRIELNPGFSVYGPPLVNLPATSVSLDPGSTRKGGVHKQKQHKRKKIVKRPPLHMLSSQNYTNLQPDGSYSFAYRTKDHSREQSIDRNGNIHYSYQTNTKRDGNTLVIFSTQVPQRLVITNDEGLLSQETGIGSKEYLADPPVDEPYDSQGMIQPFIHELSTQQHVSRDGNISPNIKERVSRRGFFRKA